MSHVAILHFHLRPGGVTSVINSQIGALKGKCPLLIVAASHRSSMDGVPVANVPGLDYDRGGRPLMDATGLAQAIGNAIQDRWPGIRPLIHVHNPLLAKNGSLISALKLLRDAGYPLLLQVHDFAEDGRPGVFSGEPYVEDVHYAVLNRRDSDMLRQSGLLPQGVHLLPNAVGRVAVSRKKRGKILLYPVRALRRKNVGEALLLSRLWPQYGPLVITQPPTGAADVDIYNQWKVFAAEHDYDVQFEAGRSRPLSEWMAEAGRVITTSVNEGFGFAFLEPWLSGIPVVGRMLPQVCSDFVQSGMNFDNFYTKIETPKGLFDYNTFKNRRKAAFEIACLRFGLDNVASRVERLPESDRPDFASLDEPAQREALAHPHGLSEILKANDSLFSDDCEADSLVTHNREVVATHYSLDRYRKRLLTLYEKAKQPVRHEINKEVLLASFVNPSTYRMIQWQDASHA